MDIPFCLALLYLLLLHPFRVLQKSYGNLGIPYVSNIRVYPQFNFQEIFHPTPTEVLYMFSSFWLLGVESHDFSQAEKERTACKAEQIHTMTTIFI